MIVMMVAREQAARHMMGILTSSKFFVKGLSIPTPTPVSGVTQVGTGRQTEGPLSPREPRQLLGPTGSLFSS